MNKRNIRCIYVNFGCVAMVMSLLDKGKKCSTLRLSDNEYFIKSVPIFWNFIKMSEKKILDISNFSVINHNTLAFGKHDAIGFVNIESGQLTFHHVVDEQGIPGISCIAGNKNEPIYAIGEISTPSRIVLFSSQQNACIGQLKSIRKNIKNNLNKCNKQTRILNRCIVLWILSTN